MSNGVISGAGQALTVYRKRNDIQEAAYDGSLILYHARNRHTVSLNASAAALWEALAWPHTPLQLANLLHEVATDLAAEECTRRVDALLSALRTHDLIETVG